MGAAISAYAFLRFKGARELPPWTQELCERFPWFSDGAVIWAEHHARLGQHGQALSALLLLEQRGLPLLSAGLGHAVPGEELGPETLEPTPTDVDLLHYFRG